MTNEAPEKFEVEDPQVWLAKFKAHAEELQKASQDAQARMSENKVTVEDKLMRLTLNSSGAVEDMTFLTPAGAASATELTTAFRALYAKAGAKVARETMAVMASLAGDDDPSVGLIRASVPENVKQQLDEEDAEAAR